jgi:uncharacterized protein YvpB
MADTIRDNVLNVLTELTGKSIEEIEGVINKKVDESQ